MSAPLPGKTDNFASWKENWTWTRETSILNSGLFSILNINPNDIDFNKCDEFATSNMTKQICEYKN